MSSEPHLDGGVVSCVLCQWFMRISPLCCMFLGWPQLKAQALAYAVQILLCRSVTLHWLDMQAVEVLDGS